MGGSAVEFLRGFQTKNNEKREELLAIFLTKPSASLPSSRDADGRVFDKEEQILSKEENNSTAPSGLCNPSFLPNNMPYTGILKLIWHTGNLVLVCVGKSAQTIFLEK